MNLSDKWFLEYIIPKCKDCVHRVNLYCKAYQFDLELLNTVKCKRYKKNGI